MNKSTSRNLSGRKSKLISTYKTARFEKFLREIGLEPAQSTSRNPLESP